MDVSKFEQMFSAVLSGKSLRECEEIYGIDRETFKKMCDQRFPKGSENRTKLGQILSFNKSTQNQKKVEDALIKRIVEGLVNGTISTKAEALAIMEQEGVKLDISTLREKIASFLNNVASSDLRRAYIEYEANLNKNYNHINFKALIIEMIRTESTQTEMAQEFGIPARTVSRELAKLEKEEEYYELYNIAKELAHRQIEVGNCKKGNRYHIFSTFEKKLIEDILSNFDEGEIIVGNPKSELQIKYEKAKKLLEEVKETGLGQKAAAQKLGSSISSIRRAKVTVKQYEERVEAEKREEI